MNPGEFAKLIIRYQRLYLLERADALSESTGMKIHSLFED